MVNMMSTGKNPNIKSAARTLDVIEYIVHCAKPPTFRGIREALDIPKSSLSNLLQDLIDRDYLYSDPDTRMYYPGLNLIQLGAACINNTDLSREVSLGVKKLSDELGVTTHAALLDGRYVVYIAKCQSTTDLSVVSSIGFRMPAHATAVGKVLLAALGPKEWEARLHNVQLERYTENTIISYEKLIEELKDIVAKGYAVDNQEIIPGGICVAAPIYDKTGRAIAAISATVHVAFKSSGLWESLFGKVKAAAGRISMRLGKPQ